MSVFRGVRFRGIETNYETKGVSVQTNYEVIFETKKRSCLISYRNFIQNTSKQTNKQTSKQTNKQTSKQTNGQASKQTNKQANKQTNVKQTNIKQPLNKQTNKQTSKQTNKQTLNKQTLNNH